MEEYKLRIYSASYEFKAECSDFLWLKCEREVNQPGLLQVDLLADHPALAALEQRGIIELWRSNDTYGLGWYRESTHFYLGIAAMFLGYNMVRLYCPGILWLLSTRVIAWEEGTAGKTNWTDKVDAIGRGLVLANAGSGATGAAGRLWDGVIPGMSLNAVIPSGEVITWVTGRGDLLEELQKLAEAVNDDFSLDLITSPFGWLFAWHNTPVDRSARVTFQLELGTMSEPVYTNDQRKEKTVCIVAGPDSATGREYTVVVGQDWSAGHSIEDFIYAPSCNLPAERTAAGSAELAKKKVIERLSFKVKQVPAYVYGRDYFLGDLVDARYLGYKVKPKVAAVVLEQGKMGTERIDVICRV